MSQNFYLNRTLFSEDQKYTEVELLTASNYIVILAEPGAGKTELLNSMAQKLGVREIHATVFRYAEVEQKNIPVVIDAFDELAKVDDAGIHNLLAKVSKTNPTYVIISSRSSEWNNSATKIFEQFVGHLPKVVRLCEFEKSEQRDIFFNHTNRKDFLSFQVEVSRFSLEPLLPNPQFLKLFADAYIESNGHFTDKKSIFTLALKNLAREVNVNTKSGIALSSNKKIELSSEIFAKLLLSGADGITISEASESRSYPLIGSLLSDNNVDVSKILATRLFRPSNNADQHQHVHKIVAEYCAAGYLIKRIVTPEDPLTLTQCLSIIAPKSLARDELRGLLGWMATLGSKQIEEAVIELDSYAVLANGDPSQLEPSSKRLLLSQLKEVEAIDPNFRRGDLSRRFSVAGFFTKEVMEDIKPIILDGSDGDLRNLLLELLVGLKESKCLVAELRQLILSPVESKNTRMLAKECLLGLECYDPHLDINDLITEASSSSLNIVAKIIESTGTDTCTSGELEEFFKSCVNLYPSHGDYVANTVGERYFIKRLISCLALEVIMWLLDSLSKNLTCICGKHAFECDCRTGISKIIGFLLDRYFELAKPPFDPLRIWQWVENLNFHGQGRTQDMTPVKLLRENGDLRQGIITHVFGKLINQDQILQIKRHKFGGFHSHAGLCLNLDDHKFIVDLAFENDNTELWVSFMAYHQFYRDSDKRVQDRLRYHMREQASKKPEFMRRWAYLNRQHKIQIKEEDRSWHIKHRRLMKRHDKSNRQIHAENIEHIQGNRELVEGGQHWGFLVNFATSVLHNPEKIEQGFGDEKLVRAALRNCLDFIEPLIPNLQKLAELHCASKYLVVENILLAACFEIMRFSGNLDGIKPSLLIALRTSLNIGYDAVERDELDAIKVEIDRLIFLDTDSIEKFLRQYIEPQLEQVACIYPKVDLLKYDETFSPLRKTLSIEWLRRFDKLVPYATNTLFDIAAQNGDRKELNNIILDRCFQILSEESDLINEEELEQKRKFWFGRAFYFLSLEKAKPYWTYLKSDKNTIIMLNDCSGRMNRSHYEYWPQLTPHKVEAILDAFFDKWPKVHLPNHYGSGSPIGETAYRFLTDIIWLINNDRSDEAIPVLSRLLLKPHFTDIHRDLKIIRAEQLRKNTLKNFEPPTPLEIVELLDNNAVVTVEGLRQLVIQELLNYQKDIDGGEFNVADRFYTKDKNLNDVHFNEVHFNEVRSVEIIAERLNSSLLPQSITITCEHQTKNKNRIDITAAKMINGKRRLLVIEAKGQWNPDLYSAASTQLYERYSTHPDAEDQGIYLIIWFGIDVNVAGRRKHGITSAIELKGAIEERLPLELKGAIDVFVLDVSRT
jgi:hypothetical protein